MSVLRDFYSRWCDPAASVTPVSYDELRRLEQARGFLFPDDYMKELSEFGLASTAWRLVRHLDELTEEHPALFDLFGIEGPLSLDETWKWSLDGNMPAHLFAIGQDPQGNHFCFAKEDLRAPRPQTARIIFIDHDFGFEEELAPSFTAWIQSYLNL